MQIVELKNEGTSTAVGQGRRIWVGKRKCYRLSQGLKRCFKTQTVWWWGKDQPLNTLTQMSDLLAWGLDAEACLLLSQYQQLSVHIKHFTGLWRGRNPFTFHKRGCLCLSYQGLQKLHLDELACPYSWMFIILGLWHEYPYKVIDLPPYEHTVTVLFLHKVSIFFFWLFLLQGGWWWRTILYLTCLCSWTDRLH